MFSRLAARTGLALRNNLQSKIVLVQSSRCSSWSKDIEVWKNANDIYYGPDRDTKNFPAPKQAERAPPVRMLMFPESWFNLFYEKTGVTGPYMLGTGILVTLLSKEFWILEHNAGEGLMLVAAVAFLVRKFGDKTVKFVETFQQDYLHKKLTGPLNEQRDDALRYIEQFEKQIWREKGQEYLYEAKRENVDLQLEEEYRKRQQQIYQDVKRRLDYQLESQNAKRRFEQNHMVNWIVGNVVKGITPQQERDSISKCINDLKVLAQKRSVASATA